MLYSLFSPIPCLKDDKKEPVRMKADWMELVAQSNQIFLQSTRPNVVNETMKRAMEVTFKLKHARYVDIVTRRIQVVRKA